MSILRDFKAASLRNRAPVTTVLVILIAVGFLATWYGESHRGYFLLAFQTNSFALRPWTLISYAFCDRQFVSILFACLWLWGVGGIVEREDGPVRYLGIWFVMSALCASGLLVGSLLLRQDSILVSPWTPVAAMTIIWGTRHPADEVRLMLVLPITARWMAWLSAAFVLFGLEPPYMAPFAAFPLILPWAYAAKRLPSRKPSAAGKSEYVRGAGFYSKEYFDEVKRREQDRAEKERLRRLFEGVGESDESKDE